MSIRSSFAQSCNCYLVDSLKLWVSTIDSTSPCTGIEIKGIQGVSMCYISNYQSGAKLDGGYFYPNGSLRQKFYYKDNEVIDSTYWVYSPDGKIIGHSQYVDGHVIVYCEYDSISLGKTYNYYVNDTALYYEKVDSSKVVTEKGILYANFKRDILFSRTVMYYYPNGVVKELTGFTNGERSGCSILYYEKGNIMSIQNYREGKLNGWSIYFDENGCLEKKVLFRNNKLIVIRSKYNGSWQQGSD